MKTDSDSSPASALPPLRVRDARPEASIAPVTVHLSLPPTSNKVEAIYSRSLIKHAKSAAERLAPL